MIEWIRLWWGPFFSRRCLVGFPWFVPARSRDSHIMVAARRMIRRNFGRDHAPFVRAVAQICSALVWPVAILVQLAQIQYCDEEEDFSTKHKLQALWFALRHNVLPGEYVAYALWKPDRKDCVDHYLYSNEASRLFKVLNKPVENDPIGDKLSFYQMCRSHLIPTPEIFAAYDASGELMELGVGELPERDLFVKPRYGLAGIGAERLVQRGRFFESSRGLSFKRSELNDYLENRAGQEQRSLLVQPLLLNDPGVDARADAGLATARLVTGISPNGEAMPILSFIYFAKLGKATMHHGHCVHVDVTSGRLSKVASYPDCDKNKVISSTNRVLPKWPETLILAQTAHKACSHCVFIGWDVAFTRAGPYFLEGNRNWSADEYQSATGEPLGHTVFAEILESQLATS